jgi:hypothetical protein
MRHFAILQYWKHTHRIHTHRKHIQQLWCLSDPGDCPVTNTPLLFDDQKKHVFHWNGQACRLCPFFSSTMLFLKWRWPTFWHPIPENIGHGMSVPHHQRAPQWDERSVLDGVCTVKSCLAQPPHKNVGEKCAVMGLIPATGLVVAGFCL